MRIASVSDLHTDFDKNREAVVTLATEIHRQGADAVIIAGDISHKNDRISRAIQAIKAVVDVVAYIPGNHDLWFDVAMAKDDQSLNTWDRYRNELKEVAESAGAHYLPAEPLVLGSVAVAGSCGWYDYSFAPSWLRDSVDEDQIAAKTYGRISWSDARFIAFRDDSGTLMSDPEVTRVMADELRAQLADLEANADVEHVVAVTHHQPFSEVVHRTGTLPWEFFTSFMGSELLGKSIQASKKVRAAIYGHSHIVGDQKVDGLRVYGTPLGYPRERGALSDEELARTRIGWLDL